MSKDCWVSQFELGEVIGKANAKMLCAHFGGLRQYIHIQPSPIHPFARLLGMVPMRLLCETYGGYSITLPNGRNEPSKEEILAAIEQGAKTTEEIALEFGVTRRWVLRLMQHTKKDPQQLRLFG